MDSPEDSQSSHLSGSQEYEEEGNTSEIFESSGTSDAEEESRLDPEFIAKRRKAKQNASRKNKNTNQLAKKILKVATATKLPHSSSSDSRSIVEFMKHMMGCSSRNVERPPAPSVDEIEAWENWAEDRQARIEQHIERYIERKQPHNNSERNFLVNQELQKIKKANLDTEYQPAQSMNNSSISQAVKNICDHEFKSKGFPRITFEWSNPSLVNSKWNGATATILVSNWARWSSNQRSLFKASDVNVTGVIERWLHTSKKELKKKESQKGSHQVNRTATPTDSKKASHKQARKKVADYRFQTASVVFREHPEVWSCFQDIDTVSDYEESSDLSVPPKRIIPAWRSDIFSELAHELDLATVLLAPRRTKTGIKARLARADSREATQDEADAEKVPENLPKEAYSRHFLAQTPDLERQQMGIKDHSHQYSLDLALQDLKKKSRPTNSMDE